MQSPHFNGRHYFNPQAPVRSIWSVLYWMLTRKPAPWPTSIPVQQKKPERQRVERGELVVTFINHSTILIQMGAWNILTDPIWSERASPLTWLGPKRVCLPGVRFEDLPPIDLVLISHNHYDHMDLPTLQRLQNTHAPTFFVSKGNQSYLESKGLRQVTELDWWESVAFSLDDVLTFVPAQHFSARGVFDRDKTLWGGFFIKGVKHRLYFAGDTGYGPHFKAICQHLGAPTLSLLPIGAFKPEWFMHPFHLSPKEAVQAHLDLGSQQSLAMHYGTFHLSDEGIDEPALALQEELQNRQLPLQQFWICKNGESKKIS